ncbi:MAG: tRNA preQ1(34) S-adenosylmethionine ribosyltransferase-isomerase QueA [Pseudomonadota bacterium]
MKLSDFDYDLPEDRIALRPTSPRDHANLLVSGPDRLQDDLFLNLSDHLRPGDHLVLNNTKVIPTRLFGTRRRKTDHGTSESHIEVTLIERLADGAWNAFAKPGKRLKIGDIVSLGMHDIRVRDKYEGLVCFEPASLNALSFEMLSTFGQMPLPPYIAKSRDADAQDRDDYQTIFAKEEGAVAAPTASLHFTDAVFARLAAQGVGHSFLTLHVGAGTFRPVTDEDIETHKMHSEWYDLPNDTTKRLHQVWQQGGRVIPVGTTALRSLETAALGHRRLRAGSGHTDIFIKPGYQFQATDGLVTNFHLPKSTLLMLVAALIGHDRMCQVYRHALANHYRFFSYGDSSLLWPNE